MVGASDCVLKSTARVGKVSKPIMEKKRRARINKCLDQLKTLLESYYTSNIRKRKLEKADILELTVKHLRSLQKMQSCTSKPSGFSDFQAGFSSCLSNVHQYLSMVDNSSGGDTFLLPPLVSPKRCAKGQRRDASSTTDSDAGTQRLLPAVSETDSANAADAGRFRATKPHHNNNNNNNNNSTSLLYKALPMEVKAEEGHSLALKQVLGIIPSKTPVNKVFGVCHSGPRNGGASIQPSMWRPW